MLFITIKYRSHNLNLEVWFIKILGYMFRHLGGRNVWPNIFIISNLKLKSWGRYVIVFNLLLSQRYAVYKDFAVPWPCSIDAVCDGNITCIRTVIICWICYTLCCETYSRRHEDEKRMQRFDRDIWRDDVTRRRRCRQEITWTGPEIYVVWGFGWLGYFSVKFDEAYLFYIRTQCVPRCKHSPLRL
jgi:hypothetical protein